jgi:hypothetical protein
VEDHTCSVVHMVTQLNSPIDCFISGWHSNGLGKAEEDLRGKGHMDAVYQILRYLKSAPGKGLIYRKNGHLNIEGYCDSDWASCADDRKSTSGYCIFVGGNLVSWKSKK